MKKLILIIAIFGLLVGQGWAADQADFPDIYIDESVAPGGVGSEADPYSDFSEINWTTGGDNSVFDYYAGAEAASLTINLKKGQTWREQLTVGESGSAAYPILIQAYSAGADPIISGADLVGTWEPSEFPGGVTQANMRLSIVDGTAFVDFSLAGALTPYIDKKITIIDSATAELIGYIKAAGTGETLSGSELLSNPSLDTTAGITGYNATVADGGDYITVTNTDINGQVYHGSYAGGISIDSGALYKAQTSAILGTAAEITMSVGFQFTKWVNYGGSPGDWTNIILYGTTEGSAFNLYYQLSTPADGTASFNTASVQQVITPSATGVTIVSSSGGSTYNWTSEEGGFDRNDPSGYTYIIEDAAETLWSKSGITTEPKVLLFDGVIGNPVDSISNVNSLRDWYWESDVLYVYSATDPDTLYTSPGVEAGQRTFAIAMLSPRSYITIDGIHATSANSSGIADSSSGAHSNISVLNCTASYNGAKGIFFYQYHATETTSDILVENCTLYENGTDGISVYGDIDDATIKKNTVYQNGWSTDTTFISGIHMISGAADKGNNILVEDNDVYSQYDSNPAWPFSPGIGIWLDYVGTNAIVRRNKVYDNAKSGIMIELSADVQVYNNVVYGNGSISTAGIIDAGIFVYRLAGGVKVYNNTVYGNFAGIALRGEDADDRGMIGHEVKNNIIFGNTYQQLIATFGAENDGVMGSGNIYLNNALGVEGANFIEWGDGNFDSTYDDWETAYGGTTNSVESDPLLTNPGSGDFTLQAGSPAINAGVDLGTSYELGLNPGSTWPDAVLTLGQGTSWEIGAYIFPSGITVYSDGTITIYSDGKVSIH